MPAAFHRFLKSGLVAAAACLLGACAAHAPLTPVSAGVLAARLANDRCADAYGQRPFHAEDFEADLENGRWHWGTPGGDKVDGFETEISFDREGRARQVMVRIPPE